MGQRVAVEAAQVGRDEGDVAQSGGGGGEQVGEVDAAPTDGDAGQLGDASARSSRGATARWILGGALLGIGVLVSGIG